MSFIVFSKDRPVQLDLLLRSMHEFAGGADVSVILKTTSKRTDDAYKEIFCDGARGIPEGERFKDTVCEVVEKASDHFAFLVDDNVFTRPMPDVPQLSEQELCFSLRLHPALTHCYTQRSAMNKPTLTTDQNGHARWEWWGQHHDWGYPMSLDGHVYRKADILPLLQRLDYANPNELELHLSHNPPARPIMVCHREACLMNIPWNKVGKNDNICGDVSAEHMLRMWEDGCRLSLDNIRNFTTASCHQIIEPLWEKR